MHGNRMAFGKALKTAAMALSAFVLLPAPAARANHCQPDVRLAQRAPETTSPPRQIGNYVTQFEYYYGLGTLKTHCVPRSVPGIGDVYAPVDPVIVPGLTSFAVYYGSVQANESQLVQPPDLASIQIGAEETALEFETVPVGNITTPNLPANMVWRSQWITVPSEATMAGAHARVSICTPRCSFIDFYGLPEA